MTLIPNIGSFPTIASVKAMGDKLQSWIGNDLEIFHDGLNWYVRGGTTEQQKQAVGLIAQKFTLKNN